MKWRFFLLALLLAAPLSAQEGETLDWNLDTIFYEPPEPPSEEPEADPGFTVLDLVRHTGFTFDGTFEFFLGLVPGWTVVPWVEAEDRGFSWEPAARARVSFNLDAQASNILRFKTSLFFTIPGFQLTFDEIFFDYNLGDRFFLRGGKFNQAWGISPNFPFANLLARVPDESYNNDSLILRLDVPLGIGGFQFLALTRANLLYGETLTYKDVGYGLKYNLASRWVDMDIGAFYQEGMPLRGFLSAKTTLGNTELYNEWMGALDVREPSNISGAVNFGFMQEFFARRFSINGELFFNNEKDTYWYRPETTVSEAETLQFNYDLNLAVNLIYRFRTKGNPRLFMQTLYAPEQSSAQLIPGFRLNPVEHLEIYFAVPMALGSENGYYYKNTADPRNNNRPFTIVILFTVSGNIRIAQHR